MAVKLMGARALVDFAAGVSPAVQAACASLWAELEASDWKSEEEVSAMFPLSAWEEGKLIVALDEQARVVVVFNYQLGIALIESAGKHRARCASASRRKASR